MTYEEWEKTVPPEITGDVVWHLTAYRLALFAADIGWHSARESRGWYYKGRHVLASEVVLHRIRLLTQIIRLLLTMIPEQRSSEIRDTSPEHAADDNTLAILLQQVPL